MPTPQAPNVAPPHGYNVTHLAPPRAHGRAVTVCCLHVPRTATAEGLACDSPTAVNAWTTAVPISLPEAPPVAGLIPGRACALPVVVS